MLAARGAAHGMRWVKADVDGTTTSKDDEGKARAGSDDDDGDDDKAYDGQGKQGRRRSDPDVKVNKVRLRMVKLSRNVKGGVGVNQAAIIYTGVQGYARSKLCRAGKCRG